MTLKESSIRAGLCSVTLREMEVPQVVEVARRANLAGIEWGADVHVPPGNGGAIAMARRATEAAGLAIPSYGSYLNPASTDEDIDAVLRSAVALGAPNVRVWAGGKEPELVDGRWTHEDWDGAVTALANMASAAALHDLTLSLEFHGWTLTHRGGAAAQLVADTGAPNLYTYFQPNYWDEPIVGDPTAQVSELTPILGDLSHLHVYWWPTLGERAPLADGAAVWGALLDAEPASVTRWSADRWAFLEFVDGDTPQQVEADAATLLGWLD